MRKAEAGNGKAGASGVESQANPLYNPEDVMRTELRVGKCVSHASRKAAIVLLNPYRKPTQVDEERILRPTGEALSGTRQNDSVTSGEGVPARPGRRELAQATV